MKKTISIFLILYSCLVSGCGRETTIEKDFDTSLEQVTTADGEYEVVTFEQSSTAEEEDIIDESDQSLAANRTDEFVVNPYFYDKEEIFLQATAKYFAGHLQGGWVEKAVYIDIDMIQAYENGCVYKFTVDIDIDEGGIYVDKSWLNQYFYVTEDKVYIVSPRIIIPSEGLEFDFNEDIHALTEMFDTDEKLVEWSTIVCQEYEMIEDQEWYYQSITKTGDQVTYYAYSLRASGDILEVCYYTWEEGRGLISCGYRYGPGEGYDISLYDIEELIVVG